MDFENYRPRLPRSIVIATLLRDRRVLLDALIEIREEAESDKDWDIVKTAITGALLEVGE